MGKRHAEEVEDHRGEEAVVGGKHSKVVEARRRQAEAAAAEGGREKGAHGDRVAAAAGTDRQAVGAQKAEGDEGECRSWCGCGGLLDPTMRDHGDA